MENILVVGANTRPIACSLNKLGYNIYSADYFGCCDLKPYVKDYKSFLSQKPYESCGYFSQRFDGDVIYEMAKDFLGTVDSVICCSGADPHDYPKHKLIGNSDVDAVENKYKLYKKLKNKFDDILKLPETFLVHDIFDAHDIADSSDSEKFLLKPVKGSGGIGIMNLDEIGSDIQIHEAILQEIIEGRDVSTSVLSSGDEARTILTSHQLIGDKSLGQLESYGYCGNIAPYTQETVYPHQNHIKDISEEIIKELKLIGSNGVDMVINEDGIHLIEVNPRLQGTFEVAESSLGINMAEAHVKACRGELMETPAPQNFAVKLTVFAMKRSQVGELKLDGVHDKPYPNVIVERGEPISTVVTAGKIKENTLAAAKFIVNNLYGCLNTKRIIYSDYVE